MALIHDSSWGVMIQSSEQACDLAVDVDVHVLGSRMLRQARHRQDVACKGDDEAGAGAHAAQAV